MLAAGVEMLVLRVIVTLAKDFAWPSQGVCVSNLMRCCLMQERHWKRAAARAVAHEIAAVTRSSMLKHTAVIDEELQSCQQKVLCLGCPLVMPA
jgi:hypothetical protein